VTQIASLFCELDEQSWSLFLERLQTVCASTAVSTKLPDEYDKFFRDSWQIGLREPNVIVLSAEDPGLTEYGVSRYKRRLAAIGQRLFGMEIGFQFEEFAEPDLQGESGKNLQQKG